MGWGTTGFRQPVRPFNANEQKAKFRDVVEGRKHRAAQFMLTELMSRTPVKSGEMRGAVGVDITSDGFILKVSKYYSWFVEKGHLIGKRSSRRAAQMRRMAKELRKSRKETGDDSLKQREDEFRKAAKVEQSGYAAQRAAGKMTKANPFVKRTIDESRNGLIAILSGKA